ncbi:hypothetical protein MPL3356_60546 [Mesorhizobium plurifarium]|uniref:Uncharacterized protein n=1 Tax=Mesorhizobium plurifarium TaxID=69974 RepID=A0A090EF80_MESPL|nr:hypothetical protein MPL3356_60546 [Mesorhizobium plurifarium]
MSSNQATIEAVNARVGANIFGRAETFLRKATAGDDAAARAELVSLLSFFPPSATLNDGVLFNCCTAHAEPVWTEFAGLEIAGCIADDDGATSGLQSAYEAQFFTVYARRSEADGGDCEAITDIYDATLMLAVAGELALRSGLPCIVHPSLSAR